MIEETVFQKEQVENSDQTAVDLIIIGAGPAGVSAAICACRAGIRTIMIDTAPGGQTSTAYRINNYLGFPKGILGPDLSKNMEEQLEKYDVQIVYDQVVDITNIRESEKLVQTDLGSMYRAKAIIVATGLVPKPLDLDCEKRFMGRGISYYAQGDAAAYSGKQVAVIGGGNCACYAADYLSEFVSKLYLIHKSDKLKAVKLLKERVMQNPKIDILWNTLPEDVFGIDGVEKLKLRNTFTDQHTWIDVKGVFVYVGRIPPDPILSIELELDEKGFIITDEMMRTNITGVYAAGDIRSKQIRQVATAVSDGMIAAINVERDLFR